MTDKAILVWLAIFASAVIVAEVVAFVGALIMGNWMTEADKRKAVRAARYQAAADNLLWRHGLCGMSVWEEAAYRRIAQALTGVLRS
jgi:hypothetical protein